MNGKRRIFAMLIVMTLLLTNLSTTVLAATWTIRATVTWCGNGGTFPDGKIKYSKQFTGTATTGGINNVECMLPSVPQPTQTGYKFLGWAGIFYEDVTENGKATLNPRDPTYYNAGSTIYMGNGETRYLIAMWEKISYAVTYHYNDGVTEPTVSKKYYGSKLTINKTIPVREGYDFLGWDTKEAADTVVWNPGDAYTDNAALDLYAVWKPHQYTIIYHDNGGTGSPEGQVKIQDVNMNIPQIIPARAGFTFLGWSENEYALEATYQPGDPLENRNMELYAVWRIVLPSNSVSAVGCSGSEGDQTIRRKEVYLQRMPKSADRKNFRDRSSEPGSERREESDMCGGRLYGRYLL